MALFSSISRFRPGLPRCRFLDARLLGATPLYSERLLSSTPCSTAPATPTKALAFRDHEAIFRDVPSRELIRAYAVFRLCGIRAFVDNAQYLLALGNRILGKQVTRNIIKHTFFKHFVAGEWCFVGALWQYCTVIGPAVWEWACSNHAALARHSVCTSIDLCPCVVCMHHG